MMVAGVLAALHHARTTGEGQFVDVAMMDALIALCESMTWRYTYTGEIQAPRGAEHPSLCPFELYDAADGQVAIAAPGERHWQLLCQTIGRPEMFADAALLQRPPDGSTTARRCARRSAHGPASGTRAEIIECLAGRVPCGPVNNAADLAADPHVRAREMYVAVEHAGSGRPVLTPNTPIRFATTPGGVYRRAPLLDEHRAEILAELASDRRRPPCALTVSAAPSCRRPATRRR